VIGHQRRATDWRACFQRTSCLKTFVVWRVDLDVFFLSFWQKVLLFGLSQLARKELQVLISEALFFSQVKSNKCSCFPVWWQYIITVLIQLAEKTVEEMDSNYTVMA
jgi:hypothetical protein